MKQFNLEEYLANPERKVVTRIGEEVKILCIAQNKKLPVIGYINDGTFPSAWYAGGQRWRDGDESNSDLFFADEESENEKIRKDIIAFLQSMNSHCNPTQDWDLRNRWLPYLEKQKEQKPAEWKPLPESMEALLLAIEGKWDAIKPTGYMSRRLEDLYDGLVNTFDVDEKYLGNLPKTEYTEKDIEEIKALKEKIDSSMETKPAEWSEEYREEDVQTRFAFYTYKDDPSVLYLSNVFVEEASRNHGFGTRILKAAEKAAEMIGATTICLKVKQDSSANAWYRKNGYGYMTFEDGYDWLEKNLEYTKPIEQEWSEEDKRKLNRIYEILGHAADDKGFLVSKRIIGDKEAVELQDFLESLLPRLSWKPSKEQMNELLRALIPGCDYDCDVLQELYFDLKKLMEE